MSLIAVGVNVTRWWRLRRFIEKRWGERNPDRANHFKRLLRNRYGGSRWERLRRFVEKRWGERDPELAARLKRLLRNRCDVSRRERLRQFIGKRWGKRNPDRANHFKQLLRNRCDVSRRERLHHFIEKRWGERNPDRANRLKRLLHDGYGERKRRRTYSEIVAQEAGRKRRAEDRKVEGRHQFLRYLDLQEVHDEQAEIDLGSLARIAVGVKGANRHEQLFFTDLAQPESLMVLAHERPPWDPEYGPERTPGAIQLTPAESYWWCTTGRIAWFDGKWHPLTDEQGQDLRDAEGRPPFLTAYPGPDPGRIDAWRRGADMATWRQGLSPRPGKPRWDQEEQKLWFGTVLCRKYERKAPNQFAILDSFETKGWPESVPDPTDLEQLKQTIDDLNKGLTSSCPIRFGVEKNRACWTRRRASS